MTTLLGFLKVFRLLRLGRVARKIDKYLEYGASTFFLLMLSFCLVAHWFACLFYLIATHYDKYDPHGWLQILGNQVGTPYKMKNGTNELDLTTGPTIASKYVSALYYTLTSLTTIGFGNISPNTTAEKLFASITMLLGGECAQLSNNFELSVEINWLCFTSLCGFSRKHAPHGQPIRYWLKPYGTWVLAFPCASRSLLKFPRDIFLCFGLWRISFLLVLRPIIEMLLMQHLKDLLHQYKQTERWWRHNNHHHLFL